MLSACILRKHFFSLSITQTHRIYTEISEQIYYFQHCFHVYHHFNHHCYSYNQFDRFNKAFFKFYCNKRLMPFFSNKLPKSDYSSSSTSCTTNSSTSSRRRFQCAFSNFPSFCKSMRPLPDYTSPTQEASSSYTTDANETTKNDTTNSKNQKTNATNSKGATSAAYNSVISQICNLPSHFSFSNTREESPITQVIQPSKSRHRGFLSHFLCCFRPSTSNVYENNANNIHKDNEVLKKHETKSYQDRGEVYQSKGFLLPAKKSSDDRVCLVIDLDETLVHSSFKKIDNADFIVPVEIDGTLHKVYVSKRPHVDQFLKTMGELFECILFTASLAKYADPVADLLDKENIFKARLYRDSCQLYRGNYVKDLSRLGRALTRVIIIDNSPASYIFHPDNALPVSSYFDNKKDTELLDLIPILERVTKMKGQVVPVLEKILEEPEFKGV